jgi:hypothetical protein
VDSFGGWGSLTPPWLKKYTGAFAGIVVAGDFLVEWNAAMKVDTGLDAQLDMRSRAGDNDKTTARSRAAMEVITNDPIDRERAMQDWGRIYS